MLIINYNHELHGEQNIKCKELVNIEGVLHVKNIYGVTFQTLNPNRIINIECEE